MTLKHQVGANFELSEDGVTLFGLSGFARGAYGWLEDDKGALTMLEPGLPAYDQLVFRLRSPRPGEAEIGIGVVVRIAVVVAIQLLLQGALLLEHFYDAMETESTIEISDYSVGGWRGRLVIDRDAEHDIATAAPEHGG